MDAASTTTTGIVTAILKLIGRFRNRSVKVELQPQIPDLQRMLREANDENAMLREELRTVKMGLAERAIDLEFVRRGNAYWDGETAYCVRCYESGEVRSLVVLDKHAGSAQCPACNQQYRDVFPRVPFEVLSIRPPKSRFDGF